MNISSPVVSYADLTREQCHALMEYQNALTYEMHAQRTLSRVENSIACLLRYKELAVEALDQAINVGIDAEIAATKIIPDVQERIKYS